MEKPELSENQQSLEDIIRHLKETAEGLVDVNQELIEENIEAAIDYVYDDVFPKLVAVLQDEMKKSKEDRAELRSHVA